MHTQHPCHTDPSEDVPPPPAFPGPGILSGIDTSRLEKADSARLGKIKDIADSVCQSAYDSVKMTLLLATSKACDYAQVGLLGG